MNSIFNIIKKDDKFLFEILSGNKSNFENIHFFINRIINNLNDDLIIVTPNKRELAYISSIYSSLNFFYNNYENQIKNLEKFLIPGQYVSLVSSGNNTGTIFKFLGRDENNINLETVPNKIGEAPCKIQQKLINILQFSPTIKKLNKKNKKNIGGIPKNIEIPELDNFLNIKSYKNPLLYDNKIILLNNSVERFENFYENQTLIKNEKHFKIKDLISFGSIDLDGNVADTEKLSENKKIEKNILATSNTGNVYNYLKNENKNKIIISSEIKKISTINNFIQYKQIKSLDPNTRFVVFADENDFEEIKELKKKNEIKVFKLFNDDLKNFLPDNISNKSFSNEDIQILRDIDTKINKKIIDINVGNEIFEKIDQCFENINSSLINQSDDLIDDIKNLLVPINNLRFRLRDHIFGFTEELSENLKKELKEFSSEVKSRRTEINEKIYDNLSSIINLFNEIPLNGFGLFEDRLRNFHEILKINKPENTIIYSYNLERKKYYEDNIKKLFNLNFKAITSKNSKTRFENLIIPSEIISKDMVKLINNSNFKNLYFLGSNNLIRKLNLIKDNQVNKWKNYIIDEIEKTKLLNINSDYSKYLLNPNFINKTNKNLSPANIEEFLFDSGSEINLNDDKDTDKVVPTLPIQLYGDRHVYLTENFDTEILNPILDPYSYNRKKIIKISNQIVEGDILLLRDSADKDLLDRETINLYNINNLPFDQFKKIALSLRDEIHKSFKDNDPKNNYSGINIKKFRECLKKTGYKGSSQTIRLIVNGVTGCPDDKEDLKKILKACELNDPLNYKYDSKLVEKIYNYNRKYKNLRIQAGRNITPKIFNALRSNSEISFDGEPLRVDYNNDGSLSLGIDMSEKPEGWIVQVQKTFGEKRVLKNYNSTNTLI